MVNAGQPFGQVPAPLGPGKALMPLDIDDLRGEAPPQRTLTPRLVWRAVRRHWWKALAVWAVASAALMVVIYYKVRPTYESWASVRVEPPDRPLYGQSLANFDLNEFKETQVRKITFPPVLQAALSGNSELLALPLLARAEDSEKAIRDALKVNIVPKTSIIAIGMASEDPNEAAAIVNAVTDAYMKIINDDTGQDARQRAAKLEEMLQSREDEVTNKRRLMEDLQTKYGLHEVEQIQQRDTATLDQYARMSQRLLEVRIEIDTAEQALALLRVGRPVQAAAAAPSPEELQRRVDEMFNADPEVRSVRAQIGADQQAYDRVRRTSRNPGDPAVKHQYDRVQEGQKRLAELYATRKPLLAAQLTVEVAADPALAAYESDLGQAEQKLAGLRASEASLAKQLEQLNVQSRQEGSHALQFRFAESDWRRAMEMRDMVQRALDQARFEMRNSGAKIRLEYKARPAFKPASNPRFKVMALAPFVVMGLIVGMLVLVEMQSGRVTDPDDLPNRLRLQVLGVVPPLPQVAAPRALGGYGGGDYRAQRRLDEFVQSLDHLRVALTSARTADGRPMRVVLITSACGSEGKTTLAAQLAERCVNAGLMTLLIDGDLRNPTLSRVLEASGGRGLVNVLRDEISAEEALTVVGGAGGFHLMPAGTPRVDPSRLLQGDRLGRVLAQARESFDIVIIDAPPVLPVPDALSMGRWVDGVVLAVRHDTSRFPLVERAYRRLGGIGVPVLGAVVNGVRSPSGVSSYGSYYTAGAEMADA